MKYVSDLAQLYNSFPVGLDEVERFIDWAENNLCLLSEWDKVKLQFCNKAVDCVDLPPQKPLIQTIPRGE